MANILLRQVLKKKKVKIKDVAEKVPYSRATIYRILNGEVKPTLDDLEEFAKVLDVPLEDLYNSKYSGEWWLKK